MLITIGQCTAMSKSNTTWLAIKDPKMTNIYQFKRENQQPDLGTKL